MTLSTHHYDVYHSIKTHTKPPLSPGKLFALPGPTTTYGDGPLRRSTIYPSHVHFCNMSSEFMCPWQHDARAAAATHWLSDCRRRCHLLVPIVCPQTASNGHTNPLTAVCVCFVVCSTAWCPASQPTPPRSSPQRAFCAHAKQTHNACISYHRSRPRSSACGSRRACANGLCMEHAWCAAASTHCTMHNTLLLPSYRCPTRATSACFAWWVYDGNRAPVTIHVPNPSRKQAGFLCAQHHCWQPQRNAVRMTRPEWMLSQR